MCGQIGAGKRGKMAPTQPFVFRHTCNLIVLSLIMLLCACCCVAGGFRANIRLPNSFNRNSTLKGPTVANVQCNCTSRNGNNNSSDSGATVPCVACKKSNNNSKQNFSFSEEELHLIRVEEIKLQILKKLKMKDRPHSTIKRDRVPKPIMQWDFPMKSGDGTGRNMDDYYAKTEQVIIMAENTEHPSCPTFFHDPAGCFLFKLTNDAMDKEITSAELWVYKLRDERDQYNQTYYVSEFVKNNHVVGRRTNTVAIRDTSLKDGWLKFDVTTTVRRWIMKSNSNSSAHMLEVSCKTCALDKEKIPVSNDLGEQPFIVINLGEEREVRRHRRGVMCEWNSTGCCLDTLYINFTDIDWSDWVLQPEGYYANYCRGSCLEDISTSVQKHTTVIQKFLFKYKNKLTPSELANLSPCCTSTRTSSLSIIYADDDGRIFQDRIPNMTVDSCGCN